MQLPTPGPRWDARAEAATRDILMQADAQNLKRGRPAEVGALTVKGAVTVTGDVSVTGAVAVTGSFSLTGDLLFVADGTYDIGAAGATRPDNIYVKTALWVATDAVLHQNATHELTINASNASGVIMFRVAGSNRWAFSSAGHLLAQSDGSYDIGASGATRPRYCYLAQRVVTGDGWQFDNGTITGAIVPDSTDGFRLRAVTNHKMTFATNDVSRWQINTSGHLLAYADNTYDIGASGANRPRDIFVARDLYMPTVTANGAGTVTISNLRPGAASTATISGWLKVMVNGTASYIPFWR